MITKRGSPPNKAWQNLVLLSPLFDKRLSLSFHFKMMPFFIFLSLSPSGPSPCRKSIWASWYRRSSTLLIVLSWATVASTNLRRSSQWKRAHFPEEAKRGPLMFLIGLTPSFKKHTCATCWQVAFAIIEVSCECESWIKIPVRVNSN